jgi:hypothetical protein
VGLVAVVVQIGLEVDLGVVRVAMDVVAGFAGGLSISWW